MTKARIVSLRSAVGTELSTRAPWPKVKLGEICDIFTGKKDVNQTVTNGPYRFFSCAPTLFRSNEYIFDGAAIIVAGNGSYTGRVTYYEGKFDLYQRTYACTIAKQQLADIKFIYDVMRLRFQKEIRGSLKGASIPYIVKGHLSDFEIPLPPLPVQRRIADVLSAYDDLIENNRRRIAILEETARLAYRKWFGGVEEGRTATLGEIADVVMGQSPESKTYNDNGEGLPFHQGVTGFGFRYPRNEMWCTAGTRFAEEGDILFSVRAPVGRINVAGERIVIGRGLSAMRAKNGFQSWLLYALKHHFSKEDMIGVGCIFASTTKKELLSVALPFPPDEEIAAFEQIAGPIDAQIKAQSKQNAALATARDMLLPRLMKGFNN